jgi:hypothetical protein
MAFLKETVRLFLRCITGKSVLHDWISTVGHLENTQTSITSVFFFFNSKFYVKVYLSSQTVLKVDYPIILVCN